MELLLDLLKMVLEYIGWEEEEIEVWSVVILIALLFIWVLRLRIVPSERW